VRATPAVDRQAQRGRDERSNGHIAVEIDVARYRGLP
jgi:hypothetical protein